MKRKTLTTAVLAGLTGMAGMVSVSNAVNLNPDGLGQVLLYPYYSARGGNDTLLSIVNTTDQAKSVKVRFLEGLNSREVLDFNIYMSAFDVWVAAVTEDGVGGAKLIIPDRTCTVPYLFADTGEEDFGEQEFLTFAYTGDFADGGPGTRERLASGYFEFIEMGELTGPSAVAATHVNGVPPATGAPARVCGRLVDAWTFGHPGSYWVTDRTTDHNPPTGGLFGGAAIINVDDGTMFSYNAYAIDAFAEPGDILHFRPEILLPDLNSGDNVSRVFIDGEVDDAEWPSGFEAVNATITYDRLMNEYVTGGITAARSEWVVTFPTKRFHVDPLFIGVDEDPILPFTSVFDGDACETLSFRPPGPWDREEQEPTVLFPPPRVSPEPPDPTPDVFELCFEANVIRFGSVDDVPVFAEITKEPRFATLGTEDVGFTSGWVRFNFEQLSRVNSNDEVYIGLPVIGFWVNTFSNDTLLDDEGHAVLSNYGGTFQHRGSRRIDPAS